MHFASDNSGPVHENVLAAIAAANVGAAMAYGNDDLTDRAITRIREVFEAPEAAVYLVASGTAANAILLSSLARPWQTIFATPTGHIHEDECGAVEFMSGGAKLTLVDGADSKMDPVALVAALDALKGRDVHSVRPGAVSITNVTERGTLYTPGDVAEIADIARSANIPLHMDGARFANAVAAQGCAPADLTWRAGVDALSLGATKNGCLAAEALVVFDPALAGEIEHRRMRAGHLLSKHRFLAAQFLAWLEDDLWLSLARRANAATQRLVAGLEPLKDVSLIHPPQANMIFAAMPRALHQKLFSAGAAYHLWSGAHEGVDAEEPLTARLVCDWSKSPEDIDRFLEHF